MLKISRHSCKITFIVLAIISVTGGFFGNYRLASATVVYDQTAGLYTDDFTDASGIAASSNAGVNVADGMVELQNAGGAYAAPYSASGTVTLQLIRPLLVAKWGTVSIVSATPPGTSIKVQALDDAGTPFKDEMLPGNEAGLSSFPADLSGAPILQCANPYFPGDASPPYSTCHKPGAIYIRFILTTTDPSVTPSIDSMQFTYTTTQGDLSASGPSTDPWPVSPGGNEQGTNQSPYHNDQTYPAFRWAGAKTQGIYSLDKMFVLHDKLFAYTAYAVGYSYGINQSSGYMLGINKSSGSELWSLPFERGGEVPFPLSSVSQNGTFYGTDYINDRFYAIDTATGQIKWVYNFYGGHGNESTVIGSDGTIFTVRDDGHQIDTVYAFNPDGTVKWTQTITSEGVAYQDVSSMSIGPDGTLYYGTTVYDDNLNQLDQGKLYALDPTDGTVKWTYNTGDISWWMAPLVDASGTIYVGTAYISQDHEIKLFAINPNGTLKWERGYGTGDIGFRSIALKNDGNLWLEDNVNWYGVKIISVSSVDGSIVSGDLTTVYPGADQISSDSVGGLYYKYTDSSDPVASIAGIRYYDADQNLKWEIPYSFDASSGINYSFNTPVIDENGWMYSVFGKANSDSDPSQEYAQVFALAPWTLTPSTSAETVSPNNNLAFSVTTSMQQTNPLTNDANQMQVVLDNGDTVPLTYASTDSAGDTVWTGSYLIPGGMTPGAHTYTVQANAALVKTDIATTFASPANGSDNTGLTTTGSFNVLVHSATATPAAVIPPSLALSNPTGGETYVPGAQIGVDWTSANGAFVKYRVSYSPDNGATWTVLGTVANTSYTWTVPTSSTTQGLIKVDGLDPNGNILATATSAAMTVNGTTVAPAPTTPPTTPTTSVGSGSTTPPATDPTVTGTYDTATAQTNNPDFNTDMNIPAATTATACVSGTLIKSPDDPAVYYCGADGKRYVFVNDKAYFSWYPDFSTVKTISDATLGNIMVGGNITYRPGTRMVKIVSDPKVYVVARGGVLRWVETEAAAIRLFGANWNKMIDDISDSFFVNYKVGTPIAE
jgi:outer membrane protein assembly factor BamB